MNQHTRIMLVGGGSGGHFYPLISLAETLNSLPEPPRLYYIGPDPYDPLALEREQIIFIACPAGKQRRYFSIKNFFDLFVLLAGIVVALFKLYAIYPDVVVSKGGYTSVPVVLAAWFLRIPIIVHESDAVPGRANKLGARFARVVAISYEEVREYFPKAETYLTGIPLRREIVAPPPVQSVLPFVVPTESPTLLVLGGSQGAERINTLILDSLDELLPLFDIIHQTGKSNYELTVLSADKLILDSTLRARYHPVPFMEAPALNEALHRAHFVISRAGSTSIYEIAAHGKPAIVIPIPETVSHDQRQNAYAYARTGAAVVMEEKNLHDGLLRPEIERIMRDQTLYTSMSAKAQAFAQPDAAQKLAEIVHQVATSH